jgi:hypothetical protein
MGTLVDLLVRLSRESPEVKRVIAHELQLRGVLNCPMCDSEYSLWYIRMQIGVNEGSYESH